MQICIEIFTSAVLTNVYLFLGPQPYHGLLYGKVYLIRYTLLPDDNVAIELDHLPYLTEAARLTRTEFEQWFLPVLGKRSM